MATVVHVPKDTRFGDLGAGLGNVLGGIIKLQDEKDQEESRKALVDSVIQELGLGTVAPALTESLTSADSGLEINQIMDILGSIKQESDTKRIEEGMSTITDRIAAGEDFTKVLPDILEFMPREVGTVANVLSGAQDRSLRREEMEQDRSLRQAQLALQQAGIKSDELDRRIRQAEIDERTRAAQAGEELERRRTVTGEREQALSEKLAGTEFTENRRTRETIDDLVRRHAAGEIDTTELAVGVVGASRDTAGQILPSIITSERPKDQGRTSVTMTKVLEDGRRIERPVSVPNDVDPEDYGPVQRLIQRGFSIGEIEGQSAEEQKTQFDREIETIIKLNNLEGEDAETFAINMRRNRPVLVNLLDENFKILREGSLEPVFQSKEAEITYNLALEKGEDRLLQGDRASTAARIAIDEAEVAFFNREWIPDQAMRDIQQTDAQTAEQKRVDQAANLAIYLQAVRGFEFTEAKMYLRQSLGQNRDARVTGFKLSNAEIDEAMRIARNTIEQIPIEPVEENNPNTLGGFLRGIFGGR